MYLHELTDGFVAERGIREWGTFYNTDHPHAAGVCQRCCPLISFSGLSQTGPAGCQFRVLRPCICIETGTIGQRCTIMASVARTPNNEACTTLTQGQPLINQNLAEADRLQADGFNLKIRNKMRVLPNGR